MHQSFLEGTCGFENDQGGFRHDELVERPGRQPATQNSERKQTATTQGSLLRVSGHSVTVHALLQNTSGLSGPYTTSRTFVPCVPTLSTPHASQPLLAQPHSGTAQTAPPRTHRARGKRGQTTPKMDSLNSPRGPRPRTAPELSGNSHGVPHIYHHCPRGPKLSGTTIA